MQVRKEVHLLRAATAAPENSEPRGDRAVWPTGTWYAVLESSGLGRHPAGIERLGVPLVVWRRADGGPVVMRAACPHRGADLSLGRVVGDCIECPYHGFRFASDGRCTSLPCEGPNARIPQGLAAISLPAREAHGLVWVYWGDRAGTLPDLPWFDDPRADDARAAACSLTWDGSFERVVESVLDPHHVAFLHGGSSLGSVGARIDPLEASLDGDTIRARGTARGAWGRSIDFAFAVRYPGLVFARFGPKTVVVCVTPMSTERTWTAFRYHLAIPGSTMLARLAGRMLVEYERRFVLSEDASVIRSLRPFGSGAETNRLVRADHIVALWYKRHAQAMPDPSRQHGSGHPLTE